MIENRLIITYRIKQKYKYFSIIIINIIYYVEVKIAIIIDIYYQPRVVSLRQKEKN